MGRARTSTSTGAVSAWRFLKRNPDYIQEWWSVAAGIPPAEGEPFPIRVQTEADLKAAKWGLLAWEDPLAAAGPASPFWSDAPVLEAEPAPGGGTALRELLSGTRASFSGLRLPDGALILKAEGGGLAAQLRIADGAGFDPDGGLVVLLGLGLDLPVVLARMRDLWTIVGGHGWEGDAPVPGGRRASSCSPSTASRKGSRTGRSRSRSTGARGSRRSGPPRVLSTRR